jgi:predicted amidohydrolase
MQTSTVTICLYRPDLKHGDKNYNLGLIESCVEKHLPGTFDLFVFPEISIAGGFFKNGNSIIPEISESIPSGISTQRIIDLCKKYNTHILAGIYESDNGKYYATHFLAGPHGFIGKQRKLFPFNPLKSSVLSSGKNINSIDFLDKNIVILPCSDILLPEPFMQAGLVKPALVLCPMGNFEIENHYTLDAIIKSRAIELGAPTVAVFSKSPESNSKVIDYILYDEFGVKINGLLINDLYRIEISIGSNLDKWGGFAERKNFLEREF